MNTSIVIALPKIEDAKKIRTVLNRYGFTVAAVCNSGANALASISELDGGVLLCGYHLQDMYYRDLLDYMPDYFEMLLIASLGVISESPTSSLCVGMPLKVGDLVNTVSMMLSQIESPSPLPCSNVLSLTKRPKILSWFSGAMPHPVSLT